MKAIEQYLPGAVWILVFCRIKLLVLLKLSVSLNFGTFVRENV